VRTTRGAPAAHPCGTTAAQALSTGAGTGAVSPSQQGVNPLVQQGLFSRVCSRPMHEWFRMCAHRVRTTRGAPAAHPCGTTAAQALSTGAGTGAVSPIQQGVNPLVQQGLFSRVCSRPMHEWFRMCAHRVRTTRGAPLRNHLCSRPVSPGLKPLCIPL
jgi:ABC-type uncharacterized transport system permease subunit